MQQPLLEQMEDAEFALFELRNRLRDEEDGLADAAETARVMIEEMIAEYAGGEHVLKPRSFAEVFLRDDFRTRGPGA